MEYAAQGMYCTEKLTKHQQFRSGAYFWPPQQKLMVKNNDRIYSMVYGNEKHHFIMEVDMVMDDIRTIDEVENVSAPNAMPVIYYNSPHPEASSDGLLFMLVMLRNIKKGEELVIRSRNRIQAFENEPPLLQWLAPPPPVEIITRNTLYEGLEGLLGVSEVEGLRNYVATIVAEDDTHSAPLWLSKHDAHNLQHTSHQHTFRNRATMICLADEQIH